MSQEYEDGWRFKVTMDSFTRVMKPRYFKTKEAAKRFIKSQKEQGVVARWYIDKLHPEVVSYSEGTEAARLCPYKVVRVDSLLDFEFPLYFMTKESAKRYAKEKNIDRNNTFHKKYKVVKNERY